MSPVADRNLVCKGSEAALPPDEFSFQLGTRGAFDGSTDIPAPRAMAQGGTTGSMFAGFSQTAPEPAQPATSAAAPPPGNPRVLASASSASSSARRVRPVDVTDAYSTAAPAAAPSYPQPQPSDGYFAGVDPLAEGEGSQMHPHPVGVQDSKASTGGGLRAPGQANPERRQRQGNHPERQGEADPERQREGHHPERQQREGNPGPPIQRPQASEASIYSTALSGAPADGGLAGMDGAESAIRVSKRESKSGVSEGAGPAISSNSATAVSTGAAARSKIPPVAKGFSQMDWLRLTNSGADLSGGGFLPFVPGGASMPVPVPVCCVCDGVCWCVGVCACVCGSCVAMCVCVSVACSCVFNMQPICTDSRAFTLTLRVTQKLSRNWNLPVHST
eukprot:jgi/Mesen1/4074/ME000213S03101